MLHAKVTSSIDRAVKLRQLLNFKVNFIHYQFCLLEEFGVKRITVLIVVSELITVVSIYACGSGTTQNVLEHLVHYHKTKYVAILVDLEQIIYMWKIDGAWLSFI